MVQWEKMPRGNGGKKKRVLIIIVAITVMHSGVTSPSSISSRIIIAIIGIELKNSQGFGNILMGALFI